MFLNDNGGTESAGWNAPYRGKKSDYYEGALRVPAVIRWPGEITAGSESDALLHVVDLFPTFAGLAGADTTGDLPLDGLDAWEAIAEGAASPRTEVVYSLDVIRVGDWKLIEEGIDYYGWTTDAPELYDIAEDPYETTNLRRPKRRSSPSCGRAWPTTSRLRGMAKRSRTSRTTRRRSTEKTRMRRSAPRPGGR